MIGADAAVSSIMDGDDADIGAKPALRGERNKNGERKGRGRETHSGARALSHTHTNTRARARRRACVTLSFEYTPPRGSHPGTHPRTVTKTHTPAGEDARATHTH